MAHAPWHALQELLGVERARLGFAIGELVPDRVRSLVLCGDQPYEWDLATPIAHAVAAGARAPSTSGMLGFIEAFEEGVEVRFPEPARIFELRNDPDAIRAAWLSVFAEGAIAHDLSAWPVPC